jgi:hypothetical protein
VDPAATASYARRPVSNASTPVIGVVKVWVVRFVVRFLRIGFLLRHVMASYLPRLALGPEGPRAANCHFGCARIQRLAKFRGKDGNNSSSLFTAFELCQNCPKTLSVWGVGSCYFEREQLPQVIDNKHFRIELIEFLEPVIVLRNHRVALARGPQSCRVVFLPNPILH